MQKTTKKIQKQGGQKQNSKSIKEKNKNTDQSSFKSKGKGSQIIEKKKKIQQKNIQNKKNANKQSNLKQQKQQKQIVQNQSKSNQQNGSGKKQQVKSTLQKKKQQKVTKQEEEEDEQDLNDSEIEGELDQESGSENEDDSEVEQDYEEQEQEIQDQDNENDINEQIEDEEQDNDEQIENQQEVENVNDEENKSNGTSLRLTKNLNAKLRIRPIYTGGKIIVSNDEQYIFASSNFQITKYHIENREIIEVFDHKEEEIANFAVHPTDKYLATFTKNFLLRLVNIETKEVLHTWKIQDHFALDIQFDPSGKFLAVGCVNGTIKIFDCKRGTETHSYRIHKGSVTKLVFHPHKSKYQLASTGDDHQIKIYDLIISQTLVSLNGHKQQVSALQYSETGTNIISGGEKIIIWDLVNMKEQASIEYEEEIEALNYMSLKTQKGKQTVTKNYIIVAGISGVFKAIDISDENVEVTSFKHLKTHEILKIMLLKSKNQLAMVTSEQNIIIYDFLQGPKLSVNNVIIGYNDEITDAKFRKVKKASTKPFQYENEYVFLSSNSNMLRAVNLKTKNTQLLQGHSDLILTLDVFENMIVSGGKDKTVRLYKQLDEEQKEYINKAQQDGSINANQITNHYSQDFIQVAVYHGHTEGITSLSFSPKTGRFVASCSSDKNVKLWDTQSIINTFDMKSMQAQKVTNSIQTVYAHDKDINVVKVAPNEKIVASASLDRSIKLWKTENMNNYMTLKGHKRGIWDIAFSPVEQVLASACGDQMIKLWNLQDGQCMHTLEGHIGSVLKIQWINYGLQLMSAGGDSLVKIWNTKKQICVNTFENHEGKIWALDASNYDSKGKQYYMTGANDSDLFIYEDVTLEEDKKKKQEEHQIMIEQQTFNSFIREKDYIAAAKLAFKQNFTQNFYKSLSLLFSTLDFQNSIIFQDLEMKVKVNKEHCDEQEGKIQEMIEFFVETDLSRLMVFIRDMNISQKHSKVSQKLLNYLLQVVHLDDMVQLQKKFTIQNKKKQIEKGDFEQLLKAIEVFSLKHLERQDRFIKKSFYLDFVIKKIDAMALYDQETDANNNNQQQQQLIQQ